MMDIPNKLIKKDYIIVEPAKLLKLFEWRDNNKDLVRSFTPILTDVVITVGGLHVHVELSELDDYTFKYTVYDNERKLLIEYWNRFKMSGFTAYNDLPKEVTGEELEDYRQSVISLYASLMAYMEHNKEVVTSRDSFQRKVKKGKNKKGKQKKVVYLRRRVYELPRDIKTNKEAKHTKEDKRAYTKPTDPYKVRGHWRHYKNGKKVWIPSYIKNTNKEKEAEPKHYKFT